MSLTAAVCLPAGKSALHWAAAVNNVEATLALLKNGANKDMQDSKVSPWEPVLPQPPARDTQGGNKPLGGIHLAYSQLSGVGVRPKGSDSRSKEDICGSHCVTWSKLLNISET